MLTGLWLFPAPRVWAEPVSVKAAAHEDFGRIVFNWSSPVRHSADMAGKRLIVRFGRPIETTYGGVVRVLRKYLRGATPGTDGRSVIFTLKKKFGLRNFDLGSAVIVDLMEETPSKPTDASAGLPDAAAKTAGKAPLVRVRSGEHKGYSRIVFDWPRKVNYQVERSGDTAIITFRRAARVNLKALRKKPPKYVKRITSKPKQDHLSVTLKVSETSRLRHFLSGPKVVIDVMAPSEGETEVARASPPLPNNPAAAEKSARPAAPPETAKEARKETAEKQAATVVSKPTPLVPARSKTPAAADRGPAGAPKSADVAAAEQTFGMLPGVKISAPAAPAPAAVPVAAVTASALQGSAVGLRFDWNEPVAAAVFRRAGFLWVVFDKSTAPDLDKLRAAGTNIIRGIERIASERATILRMTTVAGVNPDIKRDGLAWILEFRQQPLKPKSKIEIKPQPNPPPPVTARLFLPVPNPGNAIALKDPEVGDNVVVVPVFPLGHGIERTYQYPQVRILPTSQGVVIQPLIDDLRVRPLRQGIEVTSSGGLLLSPVGAADEATAQMGTMKPLTRIFDLKKWARGGLQSFTQDKRKLQDAAAKAKNDQRTKARLDLIRFHFANGFSAEALGILRVVGKDNPEMPNDPEFRALRGASSYLMGRYQDARKDLYHESLDENDEAIFWRAALVASEGNLAGAARALRRKGSITRPYPKAIKMPLALLVAEAAIMIGDIKQAENYLQALKAEEPNPAQKSQLNYVEGRFMELAGDFDGAIGKWEEVQTGPHRPSRAKAAMARTELLLKLHKFTPGDAIEEFEKLRFAWRGDDFEFALLRRLGHLYLKEGDFRNGLRTLRQAATHFRNHKKAPEVTQDMVDTFYKLYLQGGADSLPPVTAIALYDEFKELAGARSDEVDRMLADRLVSVDLLDRAAELLDAQVQFRLQGVEKVRVGAQLALVHLMAQEYGKTLEILGISKGSGLPENLLSQRRHLRARALMGLTRQEEALALIKEDKSLDAGLLRAEIFWNSKNWPMVSQALRRLLRDFNAKPKKPLDDKQGRYVLNLAIALTLSGNERSLNRLRVDYGEAMETGPYREAFRLIASPQTVGLIDYGSIADKVKDVENFQAFMTVYRDRLSQQKLSSIN
ncbi:MAG: hypothetical protein V3V55_05750 [Rhodospirillales bacterium]